MTFVRRHTGSAPCLLSSCKFKIFILNKEEKSHLIIIKTFFIAFIVLHQRKKAIFVADYKTYLFNLKFQQYYGK